MTRTKWVESFARRLFREVSIVELPAAWMELVEDPVQRLELQLRVVTGEPQLAEPARGSETGVAMKPAQGSARSLQRTFSRPDPLPPRTAAVPLYEGDNHHPANAIVPLVQGDGRRPRRQGVRPDATDATVAAMPDTELSFETIANRTPEERTRLVRGAGSLVSLLRANSKEHQEHQHQQQQHQHAPQPQPSGPGEVTRFLGINFAADADAPMALPETSETSQQAAEAVVVIRNGGHRPPLQLQRADTEEPSRIAPPVPNAPPPTIDDVLSELYERIRLEYLRTYGASGD